MQQTIHGLGLLHIFCTYDQVILGKTAVAFVYGLGGYSMDTAGSNPDWSGKPTATPLWRGEDL